MNLNKEILKKAKEAKSPEELLSLATKNGFDLTEEEAKTYFAKLNSKDGELVDDELDNVAGGKKCGVDYVDGRPVVTFYETCDNFTTPNNEIIPSGGRCTSCLYCVKVSERTVCYHPERYNN